jgi:hypothetical protein
MIPQNKSVDISFLEDNKNLEDKYNACHCSEYCLQDNNDQASKVLMELLIL